MKIYKPTLLYLFKIVGLLLSTILLICIFGFFYKVSEVIIVLWQGNEIISLCIGIVFIVIFFFSNTTNPAIIIEKEHLKINNQYVRFDQIKAFFNAKGGSEPYIITKKGKKIDIELSWFRKKDRIEIKNIIRGKIKNTYKKGLNGHKMHIHGLQIQKR